MPPKPSTPSKTQKKISQCENVDLEFTERFLSLFISMYDKPSIEEITTFPPVAHNEQNEKISPVKVPPFNSGVWDLRLKKAMEYRDASDKIASNQISDQVNQLRECFDSKISDIETIFEPDKAPRPEIPLYMQNTEKDMKGYKDTFKQHKRAKPLDIASMTQQFTERLARQKAVSQERARRRIMRIKESEAQHQQFVKTLHQHPQDSIRENESAKKDSLKAKRERLIEEGRQANEANKLKSPRKPKRTTPIKL